MSENKWYTVMSDNKWYTVMSDNKWYTVMSENKWYTVMSENGSGSIRTRVVSPGYIRPGSIRTTK
jgi:hypothetical protein